MQSKIITTFFILSKSDNFSPLSVFISVTDWSKFSVLSGFKLFFSINLLPRGPPIKTAVISPNVAAAAPTSGALS